MLGSLLLAAPAVIGGVSQAIKNKRNKPIQAAINRLDKQIESERDSLAATPITSSTGVIAANKKNERISSLSNRRLDYVNALK